MKKAINHDITQKVAPIFENYFTYKKGYMLSTTQYSDVDEDGPRLFILENGHNEAYQFFINDTGLVIADYFDFDTVYNEGVTEEQYNALYSIDGLDYDCIMFFLKVLEESQAYAFIGIDSDYLPIVN